MLHRLVLALVILSGPAGRAVAAEPPAAEAQLTLSIDTFHQVEPPGVAPGLGYVSGRALAHEGALQLFDVVFLLDTSGSTGRGSGVRLDRDPRAAKGGWLSRLRSGRGDSILAVQAAAMTTLLERLDARTTRVGLVAFAGSEHADAEHAWVEVPLTTQFSRVRRGLEQLVADGPEGGTHLQAGLRRAGIELLGNRSAESSPRPGAARHIIVLTDGHPTLPMSEKEAEKRALRVARKLATKHIQVHSYAVGPDAVDRPRAAVGIAKATGGNYQAVRDLEQLDAVLSQVDLSEIRELSLRNLTTHEPAAEIAQNPDGTWGALVQVVAGMNRIEVVARSSDGAERRVTRDLVFAPAQLSARERVEQQRLLVRRAAREAERPDAERERRLDIEVE
jgi:hypothetical protein